MGVRLFEMVDERKIKKTAYGMEKNRICGIIFVAFLTPSDSKCMSFYSRKVCRFDFLCIHKFNYATKYRAISGYIAKYVGGVAYIFVKSTSLPINRSNHINLRIYTFN
jgi:hypothetical protein